MKRILALICSLAITPAVAAPPVAPRDARLDFPFLASLEIPPGELPPGCALRTITDADRMEIGLPDFRNGGIRTDPASFLIGDEKFERLLRREEIAAIYFAVYQEKDDLGVFGWSFHSSTAAQETLERVRQAYAKEPTRFRIRLAGQNVVMLWRDPSATDASFDALAKLIDKRVNAALGAR